MCSCNKVIRASYGAAIYRGLSAMLPSYRGWRLDSWVGSWLAVGGSFDEPAQFVEQLPEPKQHVLGDVFAQAGVAHVAQGGLPELGGDPFCLCLIFLGGHAFSLASIGNMRWCGFCDIRLFCFNIFLLSDRVAHGSVLLVGG